MKNLLFIVFLGSTFTTILAESYSRSCSMVNGKYTCREMNDRDGHSAFSSSVAISGHEGDSTYEGVATRSRDAFNWDQGGTGIFSDVDSPGGSRVFSGVDPYGGMGIFSGINPYGNLGIFSGVNPSDGTDMFSGLNPPFETSESEDSNPSSDADDSNLSSDADDSNPSSDADDSNPSSDADDSNPSSDADDSDIQREATEPPTVTSPPGDSDFVPLPIGIPRTFATAGSRQFPAFINPFAGTGTAVGARFPFVGTRAVAGFPFVGTGAVAGSRFGIPQAFAGAGYPFINPAVASRNLRYPVRFPFGGAGAVAYAGKRR